MVVASGQCPYKYDFPLPIRGSIGMSGIILEQGMFVLYAELRKFGINPLLLFPFKSYSNPNIAGSGFEPKPDGATLGGNVGGPSLVTLDNILEMRAALRANNVGLFEIYGDESFAQNEAERYGSESWFTTAYPGQHPSGFMTTFDAGPFITIQGGEFLRPELEDITDGDDHLDTDLHFLGGSGTLFDIDVGEVVFQPFPFHSPFVNASPGFQNQLFNFRPYYPMFQKTNGSIISLTGRERQSAQPGTWLAQTNFDAIASGKTQVDGYAIIEDTQLRLIGGDANFSNYFGNISPTGDFTFFASGLRQVRPTTGKNDPTARTYWTAQAQPTGFYSILPVTPKSAQPLMGIESGVFGFFPQVDYRIGLPNRGLNASVTVSSDGKQIKRPQNGSSQGYQVFDDCVWLTTPGRLPLSGTTNSPSKGIYPLSPFNGAYMWFRPAEKIVATSGNKPNLSSAYDSGVPFGTPGNFQVHAGLETIGSSDILRISKVWTEFVTPGGGSIPDVYDNVVRFQRYSGPAMNHSEVSVGWTFTGATTGTFGFIDNIISDLFFDGTSYWIVGKNLGRKTKFTTGLAFNGTYDTVSVGANTGRNAYINGEYVYWYMGGGITITDPLNTDPNMIGYGLGSGIGKWSIASDPADIYSNIGSITHDSAKPIIGETTVGATAATSNFIHDIIYIDSTDAIHVTPGIWVLAQFNRGGDQEMWLLRVTEQSTHYRVEEAIDLNINSDATLPTPNAYAFDMIYREID